MSEKRDWPLRQRVEVEWRDSAARGGWSSVEDHRKRRQVGPMRSIGYLLTSDKDVMQLAQSMTAMNGDVSDTITIPREAVMRVRRIKDLR